MATARAKDWDVVVTCHPPYLMWLEEVLQRWNKECKVGVKILALDGCADYKPPTAAKGWIVLRGEWGHPAIARNLAWEHAKSSFVFCWDADNVVLPGVGRAVSRIIEADDGTAGYYGPTIKENWKKVTDGKVYKGAEETAYWGGLDTNALWRKDAVVLAGGWRCMRAEDIDLGMRVQSLGWSLKNFGFAANPELDSTERVIFRRRSHQAQRGKEVTHEERWWQGRTLSVVTLQRTVPMFEKWWKEGFLSQNYPPPDLCSLVIGLDEHESSTGLRQAVMTAVSTLDWREVSIVDVSHAGRKAYVSQRSRKEAGLKYGRLTANFETCLRKVHPATQLILTWDDDTFPLRPDALRMLSDSMSGFSGADIGCVSGWYQCRMSREYVVASSVKEKWVRDILITDLEKETGLREVGMVGNGFALWRGGTVRGMRGKHFFHDGFSGWDLNASRFVTGVGQKILIHGQLRCDHDFSLNPPAETV